MIGNIKDFYLFSRSRVQADYIFWKLTESFSALLTYAIRKEFENYADVSKHYQFAKERENYCYGITSTV